MRILFTTGNAFLPQSIGGAQSTTDELAQRLIAAGHKPAVLCRLDAAADRRMLVSRAVKKLTGRRFSCDGGLGYPVYRAWDTCDPDEVITRFRPDLAIIQHVKSVPMALAMHRRGVPVVFYFHETVGADLSGHPSSVPNARYMTNSQFSARWYRDTYGVDPVVVPPFLEAERYRVRTSREYVTFVNPHPRKGVDVAIEVARQCPGIPFLFVESWRLTDEMRVDLKERLAGLDNVTLLPPTRNMREIYAKTRILLVPSQWHEAWGRVASEAHVSGIPVIGSRCGGLPESIGSGGIVIEHDAQPEVWSEAVQRLWHDEEEYARLSEAARSYARRRELDPDWQIEAYLSVAREAIGGAPGAGSVVADGHAPVAKFLAG